MTQNMLKQVASKLILAIANNLIEPEQSLVYLKNLKKLKSVGTLNKYFNYFNRSVRNRSDILPYSQKSKFLPHKRTIKMLLLELSFQMILIILRLKKNH